MPKDFYETGDPIGDLVSKKTITSFFHEGCIVTIAADINGDGVYEDPEIRVEGDLYSILDSSRKGEDILDDLYKLADEERAKRK